MKPDCAFFIPAAGRGSRLLPLTLEQCKPSLPIKINANGKIVRMIESPLNIVKELHCRAIVTACYKEEKLRFVQEYKNVIYKKLDDPDFNKTFVECESFFKESEIKIVCYLPSDTLLPTVVIKNMLNEMKDDTLAVLLCTRELNGHNLRKRDKRGILTEGEGEWCGDLGVYVINIKKLFDNEETFENFDIVKCWNQKRYIKKGLIKLHLCDPDIPYVDMGTPQAFIEIIRSLNKKNMDKNGNIIFPGAVVNSNSKNIVALPGSNSVNLVLQDCVIPENKYVERYEDVLHIPLEAKKYFNIINEYYFNW